MEYVSLILILLAFKLGNVNYGSFSSFLWIVLPAIWVIFTVPLVFPTNVDSLITQTMHFAFTQSSFGEEGYLNSVLLVCSFWKQLEVSVIGLIILQHLTNIPLTFVNYSNPFTRNDLQGFVSSRTNHCYFSIYTGCLYQRLDFPL